MQKLLITTHLHVFMLIVGVIFIPLLATPYRRRLGRDPFNPEQNNKLRLDVATLVPVGVLLWNLLIYYMINIVASLTLPDGAQETAVKAVPAAGQATLLTFEKAVAAAGESTVALATAIIFCRLFGGIWSDLRD